MICLPVNVVSLQKLLACARIYSSHWKTPILKGGGFYQLLRYLLGLDLKITKLVVVSTGFGEDCVKTDLSN